MSKCGNCLWSNIIVFLYRNPFCSEMVQNNCGHFCCAAKLRSNFSLYQSSIRFVLWTHDQLQYWFEISVDYGTDIDISICVYRIYRGEKTPIKPTPINQRTQYFACMPQCVKHSHISYIISTTIAMQFWKFALFYVLVCWNRCFFLKNGSNSRLFHIIFGALQWYFVVHRVVESIKIVNSIKRNIQRK